MMEIKPCPFCGGDGAITCNINSKIVFGMCCDCGARGQVVKYDEYLTDIDMQEAIERWNRRAT